MSHYNGLHSNEAKKKVDEFIRVEKENRLEEQRLRDIEIAKDKEAWELVCKKNNKEDYENYLKFYPNGRYSNKAKEKLNKLEDIEWQKVLNDYTITAINKFQKKFPSGQYKYRAIELKSFLTEEITYDNSQNRRFCFYGKNSKIGLVDINKNIIVPALYDNFYTDIKNRVIYCEKNNKKGLLDIYGNIIIDTYFDLVDSYDDSYTYFLVNINDKLGVYNYLEKEILPCIYDEISMRFLKDDYPNTNREKCFFVKKDDKYGLYDKLGNTLIAPKYKYLSVPSYSYVTDDIIIIDNADNNKLFLNIVTKKYLFFKQVGFLNLYNKNIFILSDDKKMGFSDGLFDIKVPLELDLWVNGEDLYNYKKAISWTGNKNIAIVKKNNKLGLLNLKTLHYILLTEYDGFYTFDEGKLIKENYRFLGKHINFINVVKKNNKFGLFDIDKVLLNTTYDNLFKINCPKCVEDYIVLIKDNYEGLCTSEGKIILDTKYKFYTNDGYNIFYNNEENGNMLYKLSISNLIMLEKDGKYGLYNVVKEKLILEIKYDKFKHYEYENDIIITIGNKKGLISFDGKWLKTLSLWNNFIKI